MVQETSCSCSARSGDAESLVKGPNLENTLPWDGVGERDLAGVMDLGGDLRLTGDLSGDLGRLDEDLYRTLRLAVTRTGEP